MFVLNDIKSSMLKAGCRALGIIYCITSPLWRIIQKQLAYIGNNRCLLNLVDLLEILTKAKNDSSDIITGPFHDVIVKDTEILKEDAQTGVITMQILQWLFEAMSNRSKIQVRDHLPEGTFYTFQATTWEDSQNTVKHHKLKLKILKKENKEPKMRQRFKRE